MNEKMAGICQIMSTLEIKVQVLEADKGTCTSKLTMLCLQVCQAKLAAIQLLNACMLSIE